MAFKTTLPHQRCLVGAHFTQTSVVRSSRSPMCNGSFRQSNANEHRISMPDIAPNTSKRQWLTRKPESPMAELVGNRVDPCQGPSDSPPHIEFPHLHQTVHMVEQLILFDLACRDGVCFSPVVWRIRLMLNYKNIPYTTVFLEFPDIEPTLSAFRIQPNERGKKYTVPTIYVPSEERYIMDSAAIAQYLEDTYSKPTLPLQSKRGTEFLSRMRKDGRYLQTYIMAGRKIHILNPRSAEYVRQDAAESNTLASNKVADIGEEAVWKQAEQDLQQLSDFIMEDEGPFIEGSKPTFADFTFAGALQSIRVVDSGVWERIMRFPGHKRVYEACEVWMKRNS